MYMLMLIDAGRAAGEGVGAKKKQQTIFELYSAAQIVIQGSNDS